MISFTNIFVIIIITLIIQYSTPSPNTLTTKLCPNQNGQCHSGGGIVLNGQSHIGIPAACFNRVDPGTCSQDLIRLYYDHRTYTCKAFSYSGCGGNANRFVSVKNCYKLCHPYYRQRFISLKDDSPPDKLLQINITPSPKSLSLKDETTTQTTTEETTTPTSTTTTEETTTPTSTTTTEETTTQTTTTTTEETTTQTTTTTTEETTTITTTTEETTTTTSTTTQLTTAPNEEDVQALGLAYYRSKVLNQPLNK